MLAFATVLVLLGGAVLVGSRRDQLDAMPTAERAAPMEEKLGTDNAAPASAPERERAAVVADPAPKGASSAGSAAPDPADVAPAAPDRTAPGAAGRPPGPSPTMPGSTGIVAAGPSDEPAGAVPTMPGSTGTVVRPRVVDEAAELDGAAPSKKELVTARPPPPPPAPAPVQESVAGGPVADFARGSEVGPRTNTADQAPAPAMTPKLVKRSPPKQDLQIADDAGASPANVEMQVTGSAPHIRNGTDSDRAEGKSVRGPTLGQLAKQSETAASRNDCAAVRAIVGRIRKLDASFHKKHVESNAAVKRCVK